MNGYSPKLPLQRDINDGTLSMNKTAKDAIKQDFKMLLLTNPGERVMTPDYGIGLRSILFEQNSDDEISRIRSRINFQVSKYMNFINILYVDINREDNIVNISISFQIPYLNEEDQINLSFVST